MKRRQSRRPLSPSLEEGASRAWPRRPSAATRPSSQRPGGAPAASSSSLPGAFAPWAVMWTGSMMNNLATSCHFFTAGWPALTALA